MTDLSTAHEQFISYLTERRRARATIVAYGKDIDQLKVFLSHMGKKTIEEVTREELEAFLKKLSKDGYTPKSVSRKINSIKTFYRFLKIKSGITLDPSVEITHPKYEANPPRILSKVEYRALRDSCRNDLRIYAIVELFLQTGIRIGELANIKKVDLRGDQLYISPLESHDERMVPLNKAVRDAVEAYLKTRSNAPTDSLFVTKTGRPLLIRNIRTAIDRYFKIAGIEGAKVNDLRHTFIAHHLMSGTPLTMISNLVGHKRLSTTEKYLELIQDRVENKPRLEEL